MSDAQKELARVIEKYFGSDAGYLDIDCFTLARRIIEAGWTKPVRCKDCKHYTPERLPVWDDKTLCYTLKTKIAPFGECGGQDFTYTEDGSLCVNENDFCSCGERRIDE